jgi:hypothetical protein
VVKRAKPAPPRKTSLPPAETPVGERTLRISDGAVYLTLRWPQLTVLAVLLIVLGVALFQAGVRSAQPASPPSDQLEEIIAEQPTEAPSTARPVDLAPQHRPDGGVRTPVSNQPNAGEPPPPIVEAEPQGETHELPPFESGRYYIIAQHFRRRARDDANAAGRFLRSNGVPCMVKEGHGDWILVITRPFTSEAGARELLRRVRSLGQDYARQGGGYDFAGCRAARF